MTGNISSNNQFKYVPVIPQSALDKEFHFVNEDGSYGVKAELQLITSISELEEFAKKAKGKTIAVDTETTGLSYKTDKIVGFSISLNAYSGIYVPIRHQVRRVVTTKKTKTDEQGNIVYTKAGRPSQTTVKEYSYSECTDNLDDKKALDILYSIMLNAKIVLLHNSEFDLNMIKFEGYDISKIKTFDTLILPYIYDAEGRGIAGLKSLEKLLLGRYRPGFSEVVGDDENFQYTDPKVTYTYAAMDSASTYGIFKKLYKETQRLIDSAEDVLTIDGKRYNVIKQDNNLIRAFVDYYGHVELKVDKNVAIEYQNKIKEDILSVTEKIYSFFGEGPFNLSTQSKEFKQIMEKHNIETGKVTDKGNKSYGKEGLKEFNKNLSFIKNVVIPNFGKITFTNSRMQKKTNASPEINKIASQFENILLTYGKQYMTIKQQVNNTYVRDLNGRNIDKRTFAELLKDMYKGETLKLDILKKIAKYSTYTKALNTYVHKLTSVDTCKMKYRLQGTSSGRLSSGNSSKSANKENKYYINLNAQNLTKPEEVYYKATKSDSPDNVLGWSFEYIDKELALSIKDKETIVEAGAPVANIRKCIVAPEGRYIVSADYHNQEAIILATLSRDQAMMSIFLNKEDIHTATAVAIFGAKGVEKKYRSIAKAINFAIAYSGNEYTVAKSLEIPVEEAKTYVDIYYERFFESIKWKEREIQKMYQNGGRVFTKLGRPRQFITRLKSANEASNFDTNTSRKIVAMVERRVTNHLVQSLCGDVCRYVLLKLYNEYFKERNKHIDFLSTVHDEINFTIDKEHTTRYIKEIEEIMTFREIDNRIPLETSIEVGNNYGQCYPFVWSDKDKTLLVPKRI